MKKICLFVLLNTLISMLFCTTVIITKYNDTFRGEIKKNDEEKLYFADTKFPDFLFVIHFHDIDSILENDENVTDKIASKKINNSIHFNSYKEIIYYNKKTSLETLLAANERNQNFDSNLGIMIKFTFEDGNMYFDGQRAFSPTGFSTSFEMTNEIIEKLHLGAGFTFQFPRDLEKYFSPGNGYQNNAIYGLVKIHFLTTNDDIDMFINAGFGYNKVNLLRTNEYFEDGTYSGIGLEIHVRKVALEIGYKRYGGTYFDLSPDEIEANTNYKLLSLSLGFKIH